MAARKTVKNKEGELQNFKEEIIHEFYIFSENVNSQLKQVAEGVTNFSEKLDRFQIEIKAAIEDEFQTVSQLVTGLSHKLEDTRQ